MVEAWYHILYDFYHILPLLYCSPLAFCSSSPLSITIDMIFYISYWSSLSFSLSLSTYLTVFVSVLIASYFHFVVSLTSRSLFYLMIRCTHLICFQYFPPNVFLIPSFHSFFLWHWYYIDIILIMPSWFSFVDDHDW